ncbi:Sorbose reductase [Mycena kentingensis (nom. inval.)]|nr:Sorbose reductase [Mycena kentingensis (nom. inval.)]
MWFKVEEVVKNEGRIDICIANAGILYEAECLDYPAETFLKVLDVNVSGHVHCPSRWTGDGTVGTRGSFILMASMNGSINPGQHWTAYNTSKAAVI